MDEAAIRKAEAGRELDALIAEQVMGWLWVKYPAPNMMNKVLLTAIVPPPVPGRTYQNYIDRFWKPSDARANRFSDWDAITYWDGKKQHRGTPDYSTNIAAAWQVVEQMKARGHNLRMIEYAYNRTYATFRMDTSDEDWEEANGEHCTPLAICRAALLAVNAETEKG